ncbi:alpha/beta fold hydrolase [Brevundimonas subvibrioides]|uniref:Alpha/beta hydrolase fold protein n=1 Tax=Brevundimonas subvibrioides (strain ATCC 15264 / DSM 4735 / LMG 14903 / NBRC 16000 / CB 81) TaxID=633149 RepID=D9QJP2_BRESC|nr:alpha/beta hydrolase [Brevundimonas subvibrioides]ADK99643.1 alpha/beta hydrolase fold protein [Brevundimonas subvibrioides ATCC 15264]
MPDSNGFSERRWTSSDGLSLFARDYPGADGPAKLPVIAIHGLTRNSADFDAIAPLIARGGRRVLALDVRGRGRSDRATDPMTYQPPVYAKDVLALLEQAGIARAVFLGTSMGGLITMALAALKTRVVAAAILNDIGPQVSPEGLARIAAYSGQPVETPTWEAAAAYAKRINSVALPHYSDADWDAFARRTFREGTEGSPVLDYDPDIAVPIRAAGPKALAPNLWPYFRRLARKRPTLLIRGATSDLLGADIADRMKKAAPDMAYAEVPGVGHAPMLDEPEAKAAIFEFLRDIP